MALPRSHALAVLTLVVLSAVVLPAATPANAAPPPESVAGLCTDDALDGAVGEYCEVVIRIQADGSANWTVRVDLDGPTARALAADADDRRERVRDELTRRTVVDEVAALDTRVENRTLVATFTTAEFAHRGVGDVLVADGLSPSTPNARVHVHALRLAVYGPEGTQPTLVPDSAVGNDRYIVWTGDADLGSQTTMAFADGGLAGSLLTVVAVGVEIVVRAVPALLPIVAVPTLLFAGVLAGLLGYGDRLGPGRTDDDLAARIGLFGGVVAAVLLAAGVGLFLLGTSTDVRGGDPAIFVGLALVSLVPQTLVAAGIGAVFALWGDRISLDSYAWWVFPAAATCWLVIVGSTGPNRILGTWTTTVMLFLLLGAAHERGTLAALPVALVALLAPTLAALPFVWPWGGPSSTLVLWTVGTLVPGVALYALGRRESARPGLSESSDTEEATAEAA